MITEEAEELSRESTNMADGGLRAARGVSTFQRFSVDTDESLCFEPCEDGLPSPIGAERGLHGDVFEVAGAEVGTPTWLWPVMNELNCFC